LLLEAFKPLGRESIFVTGTAGYNFYDRNSILNREHIDLTAGANAQLGACRATVTGGFTRRQNELDDVTLSTKIQDALDVATVGADATCGHGYGFAPILSFSRSWANNSLVQLQSSDYTTIGGSAGFSYQTPTFGNLSFFGQYQSTEFNERIFLITVGPVQDGFDIYGGGVKYVRLLGARIQGTVSLSYTSVKPFLSGTKGFDGPTYGADLTFRASSRLNFHANFTRSIVPSNVLESTYSLQTKELVEGTYDIGSRLSLNLGVSDQHRNFSGEALNINDLTSDELKSVYATLTYSLRKIHFSLNAQNSQRTANIALLSYPDTRVGLIVATDF